MIESGRLSEAFGQQGFDIHESPVYQRYHNERLEIEKLKWIESERVGHDIGMDRAMWLWMTTHRASWLAAMKASGIQGF